MIVTMKDAVTQKVSDIDTSKLNGWVNPLTSKQQVDEWVAKYQESLKRRGRA